MLAIERKLKGELQMIASPFIYGRPVRPGEFLNREPELSTIFNRLRHGESTAVVGEPHIGKTSLLLQLADEATQQAYLGSDARCLVVSSLDLHPIGSDYSPAAFWEKTLEPLQKHPGHQTTGRLLRQTAEANYARQPLDRLFRNLAAQGRRLVFLLDEFERLLSHPNFQDPAFFALLRSLATRTGGLALITASRLSVAEMNERGNDLRGAAGSPSPTPTPSPSPTPTPALPVLAGTPYPHSRAAISPENAKQVVQLARWGKGTVNEVAYSPDGQLLAVASSIGIYLYDAGTLQEVRFIATDAWVLSVAFSPDGQMLASGSDDNIGRLWGGSDGALLRALEGHTGWVSSVAFSPDGQMLASGSDDNTVRLWRVSDGALLRTLQGHTSGVSSVAFSPDGATLASGSDDGTVGLWGVK